MGRSKYQAYRPERSRETHWGRRMFAVLALGGLALGVAKSGVLDSRPSRDPVTNELRIPLKVDHKRLSELASGARSVVAGNDTVPAEDDTYSADRPADPANLAAVQAVQRYFVAGHSPICPDSGNVFLLQNKDAPQQKRRICLDMKDSKVDTSVQPNALSIPLQVEALEGTLTPSIQDAVDALNAKQCEQVRLFSAQYALTLVGQSPNKPSTGTVPIDILFNLQGNTRCDPKRLAGSRAQ